ncbi:histidine kinase [Halomarina oriensis]|uniref:Histidine kinase n=1 Tax=Halomarina oriensis TaxID=671145 RepID=A0A6B0GI84_9EURY|nr:histidine kinase [Halomarina oriensis]
MTGVAGGIVGAVVMGALISLMNPPTLQVAIPSLYTLAPPENGLLGWIVHVSHGAVLGLVFVAIVNARGLRGSVGGLIGGGVAWGVVTWVVLAALLMPVWLDAVGSPANPPFPNFAMPSLLWHVAYGAVLGTVVAVADYL